MAVKTITIKEDAYNTLKSMKRPDESFSDVILRVGKRRVTAKDIFGTLKMDKKEAERMRKAVRETRKQLNKEMEDRERVLARHFRTD